MQKKIYIQKRKVLLILLIFFTVESSMAQSVESVINTTGSISVDNGGIYEWSVGELALVETMINTEMIITNGFLQPVSPIYMVTETFTIFPTNILSPNGDGVNDAWVIKDIEKFPDNEVRIFDRGGRVIYTAKNYQNTWTGNFRNALLVEDVYYYVITLKKEGRTELKKGFITIIKD